jgi:hypothetical protein
VSGDVLRKIRNGELERKGVRDLAVSLNCIKEGSDPEDSPTSPQPPAGLYRPYYNSTPQHKFPVNSDYMAPNCLWSPSAVQDPFNPQLFSRPNMYNGGSQPPAPSFTALGANIYCQPQGNERIYETLKDVRNGMSSAQSQSQLYPREMDMLKGHDELPDRYRREAAPNAPLGQVGQNYLSFFQKTPGAKIYIYYFLFQPFF